MQSLKMQKVVSVAAYDFLLVTYDCYSTFITPFITRQWPGKVHTNG